MAKDAAHWAGKYALLLAEHNKLQRAYAAVCKAKARTMQQPLPLGCGFCGSTKPLDTSYSDDGYGWPFCPDCGGV